MDHFKVTPWEVEGKVDYDKLIKDFGTQRIDKKLLDRVSKFAKLHTMLRRGYFFSHRDLNLVLDDFETGKGFFLYTGRGPSGSMHIGHLIPMIFNKWLQDVFDVNLYIEVTDDEKFLFKKDKSWEDIQEQTNKDILDIAAVCFNPDKTFIFKDSEYIKNVYPMILKIAKKVNFSTARSVFGFTNDTNIGSIFYPAYQIVLTFFEKKRCLIPAAIDQDPYWRIQRDIAENLGYHKTAAIHNKLLPPLTGVEGKMSSSREETAIYLSDSPETVKKKVMKYAFSGGRASVEEHRKLGGNPDIDVSFQWLYAFLEDDDKKIKKIEEDYRSGKLLTGELKQILIDKLNKFLEEHRKQRKKAENLVDKFKYSGKLAKEMWSKTI